MDKVQDENFVQSSVPNANADPNQQNRESFNLQNLTPEERNALKNLQREAAIYRGYPAGLVLGGLTLLGISSRFPKMNVFGKFGLTGMAFVFGNMGGKVSYIPTALKRLNETLPEDSQLKQIVSRSIAEGRGIPFSPRRSADSHQNLSESPASGSHEQLRQHHREKERNGASILPHSPSADGQSSSNESPMSRSYEQLRQHHREKERVGSSNLPFQSSSSNTSEPLLPSTGEYNNSSANQTDKKVRYNKYGDPIIEV